MKTVYMKDRNGRDIYFTSLDVSVCPVCNRSINIAVMAVHTELVYKGDGIHWSSCGCRWYVELGEVSDVHNRLNDK